MSNRLPVDVKVKGSSTWKSSPSSGGLVAALSGALCREGSRWIGWPGCAVPERLQAEVKTSLARDGLVPVFLTRNQQRHYYEGMGNDVLWPLFHYFPDKVRYRPEHYDHFVTINQKFADAVLEVATADAQVWINDFHLMLVPEMLREARPDLEIGFFLHIPWPSSELYRLLPSRKELLRGVLGADYIGFHTSDYARHFQFSCLRVLGLEADPDGIVYENRRVGIGPHPVGIDVAFFREVMAQQETEALVQELRERYEGRKLLLGIERLDYTKGIPLKLEAFESLLAKRPELAREVVLLQLVVPSRLSMSRYRDLKREIEEKVSEINGRHGRPGYMPVEYMHRHLTPEQLVALYQAADVALVTPIRDGMNLVAQEFVLCQEGQCGMLVLSEFAGAAQPLSDAILVNPWNRKKTVRAIEEALSLSKEERDASMHPMAERVTENDCRAWAEGFLEKLGETAARRKLEQTRERELTGEAFDALQERLAVAEHRLLVLDYDGTLRELTSIPGKARPTAEIRSLLADLSSLPDTQVHMVSGRPSDVLERWFGEIPIHMCAEHGAVSKRPGRGWQVTGPYRLHWKPRVEEMLREAILEVPGTTVEVKDHSLAWHYRNSDLDRGLWAASGLALTLATELQHMPVEIIHGHRVIEVRPVGANKGNHVRRIIRNLLPGTLIVCFGDDRTDVDMYRALPEDAVCIHVGRFAEQATYFVESPERVRSFLAGLVSRSRSRVAGGK